MNKFDTLDAQSEIASLAMVASNEAIVECTQVTEETTVIEMTPAATVATMRRVNYTKLRAYNARQQPENRIGLSGLARLAERVNFAPQRRKILSLWLQIHNEVEPLRQAIRDRQAALENL